MTPVRFMEAIIGLMQDDEIAIISNALDVPATTAAEIVNKISPVPNLVIRATSDGDLVAYWKQHEEKYADAITTICEPNNAE
jgi:hypothetical protein